MDYDILMPQKLALKFPVQPRPTKLTVSQCKKRAWVFEWVVTSSQELPSLTSSETVVLVVVRHSRQQKANKLKLVKQCGRQASKIKALRFEMFLK